MTRLRAAERRDVQTLAAIKCKSWRSAYGTLLPRHWLEEYNTFERRASQWNAYFDADRNGAFLVEYDDLTVGFVQLGTPEEIPSHDHTTELTCLYLLPEWVGRGVGRGALEKAEALARRDGAQHMSLWVMAENELALRFYRQAGYGDDGAELLLSMGRPVRVIRLSKALS